MAARLFTAVALAVLLAGLSGCSRTKPLQGKWQVDRAYTEAQFSKGKPIEGVVEMFITPLLKQFEEHTLTITDKEIRKDDNGEGFTYEVVEHPTRDRWRLKMSDGTVSGYEREGERLVLTSTGGIQMKVYFKRIGQ